MADLSNNVAQKSQRLSGRKGRVVAERGLDDLTRPVVGVGPLEVLEVSRLGERTAAGAESVWVSGEMPIVSLTTPTAELEWVLSREDRDWALELVRRRQ